MLAMNSATMPKSDCFEIRLLDVAFERYRVCVSSVSAPPGPRGVPGLGVLPALARDPLMTFSRARARYGDVVRLPVLNGSVYLLTHPDHVEHVLVTRNANHWKGRLFARADFLLGNGLVLNEGESWNRQRRIVRPGFNGDRLRAATAAMLEVIGEQAERWRHAQAAGRSIDMEAEMTTLTLDLMATAMLGVRLGHDELRTMGQAFTVVLKHLGLRLVTFALPDWVPIPGEPRAKRALSTLDAMVDRMIEQPSHGDNLLGLLVSAWREGHMTRRQLRDEIMTMLFGGYEATAHALAWTWYLLDTHPKVGDRVRAEAMASEPGDTAELAYTNQVINEVLRLYPPFWQMIRSSHEPDEIGGHTIPGGAVILLVPWLTHRLPEFWTDPLAFDPGRWAGGGQPAHRYAYYPFGAGVRQCMGRPLALLEMQLVVSTLSRQFRPHCVGGRPVKARAQGTLRAHRGIPMVLQS